jgi:hypothetical protein
LTIRSPRDPSLETRFAARGQRVLGRSEEGRFALVCERAVEKKWRSGGWRKGKVRGICGGFGEVGILFLVWVCARWMGAGARGGEGGVGIGMLLLAVCIITR